MSSDLSRIPVSRRRHAAALLGLAATFLVAVGVLPWVGRTTAGVRVFATIALVGGLMFALVAWGLVRSTVLDVSRAAEAALDAQLIAAAGASGHGCSCGHDHDPDELHITDACDSDGAGTDCAHTCQTCVLGTLRA